MDIVGNYLLCCDQSGVPEVDQRCEDIKDQNENSASSVRLANNLPEMHYKILENGKNNLEPFIEKLLKDPDENKFHLWFFFVFESTILERPEENQATKRS